MTYMGLFFGRKKDDEKEGMGVLSCCGRKLRWRFLAECSNVGG